MAYREFVIPANPGSESGAGAGIQRARLDSVSMKSTIGANMTMIYWKGERFRLDTLQAREENLKDAYDMLVMEKVPAVTGVSPDFTGDDL